MQMTKSFRRYPSYNIKFENGVDKRSNRKTPGTSGEGPRPPKSDEYPDQKDKDKEEVDNQEKRKNEEGRREKD